MIQKPYELLLMPGPWIVKVLTGSDGSLDGVTGRRIDRLP
jgi:hypothetical protein